jgi:phage gp45-like
MMHELAKAIGNVRAMVGVGVVQSMSDAGGAQTVTVDTPGGMRADIEVMLPFGFTAMPPLDGAICLLFQVGADPSNIMALPISNPSARMGGLQPGEAAIYGGDGSRVHIRNGGVVELWGGASVTITTKGFAINAPSGATINAAAGCTINAAGGITLAGNVAIDGNLSVTGTYPGD